MHLQDLLVGSLSILLGLALLAGAILDGPWLMALAKPRLLAEAISKPAAQIAIGALGVGLIVLGISVARGWRMNWSGVDARRRTVFQTVQGRIRNPSYVTPASTASDTAG